MTGSLPERSVHHGPTHSQVVDWSTRLFMLVGEMEEAFGDPGKCYPRPLNMATYLAMREAMTLRDDMISNGRDSHGF